ncbi:MAG: DUF6438 domain-containing protein [Bacteroidota bacterium]
MIHTHRFLLLLTVILLALACNRKASQVSSDTKSASAGIEPERSTIQVPRQKIDTSISLNKEVFLLASIRKEPCFGRCPVYEARLFSDGRAVYIGKEYVDQIGQFEATATREKISILFEQARLIDYFNLPDTFPRYGQLIPDLPSTISSIHHKGRSKTTVNNHDAPRSLRKFEQLLETFFDGLEWNRIDAIRQ